MSNTCLVTKLKSSVQDSNLLRLGECVATLAPVGIYLTPSSAVSGTTCTFKLENGNFMNYDKTTNYGDTYTYSQLTPNFYIYLSPIDTSKNMVLHNLSKYDSYLLLVNNDNINNLQYIKANSLIFCGDVIDYDKISEDLNDPNFFEIRTMSNANQPSNINIKFIGNANRFFSKCKKLKFVNIDNRDDKSNFEIDVNSFSGSSNSLRQLIIGRGKITVDSNSLGRLYKLNDIGFIGDATQLMNPKMEISDVIDKWMENGMPAKTFSDAFYNNQCGRYYTFNGKEIIINEWAYITFENKNKYAVYYGAYGIENCKKIISYGATQEEISNWQNSGITVTVVD